MGRLSLNKLNGLEKNLENLFSSNKTSDQAAFISHVLFQVYYVAFHDDLKNYIVLFSINTLVDFYTLSLKHSPIGFINLAIGLTGIWEKK